MAIQSKPSLQRFSQRLQFAATRYPAASRFRIPASLAKSQTPMTPSTTICPA
jgi:hypothetical protein